MSNSKAKITVEFDTEDQAKKFLREMRLTGRIRSDAPGPGYYIVRSANRFEPTVSNVNTGPVMGNAIQAGDIYGGVTFP